MNYLSQAQYRKAKTALTRRINAYMESDPQRVVNLVNEQFAEWDEGNYAYPDDWHRWNVARDDALLKLRFQSSIW